MKNQVIILLLLCTISLFYKSTLAQTVGIGTTSPAASAMLEVNSTSKGMLIPRMTTAQRTVIGSPATGLLVYDITTGSFWFKKDAIWVELVDSTNTIWTKEGSNVYLNNGENVGISTTSPGVRLQINNGTDITLASGGYLQLGGNAISNLVLDNNEIQARNNGAASSLSLQSGGGNINIGNVTPLSKLDINGQITIRGGSPADDKVLTSDANGTATWRNSSRNTGFFVNANTAQNLPTSTLTVVNFPNIYNDDGNNYNSVSDYYNCPSTGFYQFEMSITFTTINSFMGDAALDVGFYNNGTVFWNPPDNILHTINPTTHSLSISGHFNIGDHVSVRALQNSGSLQEISYGFFSGNRVY